MLEQIQNQLLLVTGFLITVIISAYVCISLSKKAHDLSSQKGNTIADFLNARKSMELEVLAIQIQDKIRISATLPIIGLSIIAVAAMIGPIALYITFIVLDPPQPVKEGVVKNFTMQEICDIKGDACTLSGQNLLERIRLSGKIEPQAIPQNKNNNASFDIVFPPTTVSSEYPDFTVDIPYEDNWKKSINVYDKSGMYRTATMTIRVEKEKNRINIGLNSSKDSEYNAKVNPKSNTVFLEKPIPIIAIVTKKNSKHSDKNKYLSADETKLEKGAFEIGSPSQQ